MENKEIPEEDICPCCGNEMGIYWECWNCSVMVCEECISEDRLCPECEQQRPKVADLLRELDQWYEQEK